MGSAEIVERYTFEETGIMKKCGMCNQYKDEPMEEWMPVCSECIKHKKTEEGKSELALIFKSLDDDFWNRSTSSYPEGGIESLFQKRISDLDKADPQCEICEGEGAGNSASASSQSISVSNPMPGMD